VGIGILPQVKVHLSIRLDPRPLVKHPTPAEPIWMRQRSRIERNTRIQKNVSAYDLVQFIL
jgi:hypothetical protein